MTITLYTCTADRRKLDKTAALAVVSTMTGTATSAFNVLAPTLIISGDIPDNANYAYIEELSRYYYITNKTKAIGDKTVVNFAVDVLHTYKEDIKKIKVVASRSSSKYYRYIADSFQQMSNKPQIVYKNFSGSPFKSDSITADTKCIVVRANVNTPAPASAETESEVQ